MKNNKKGLATGLIAIVLFMFLFAISSLLALTMWTSFNDSIQSIDNSTITPDVKLQIAELGSKMLWGDKLFAFFFVAMLLAYIISSVTIPTDSPEYLFIFIVILIITSIMCMVLSNTWAFMIEQPNFIASATELTFTNHILSYYPIYAFLIGVLGGGLFYARRKSGDNSFSFGGGNIGGGLNEIVE